MQRRTASANIFREHAIAIIIGPSALEVSKKKQEEGCLAKLLLEHDCHHRKLYAAKMHVADEGVGARWIVTVQPQRVNEAKR